MNTVTGILKRLDAHIATAEKMHAVTDDLTSAVEMVVETFRCGGMLFLAGNGGSAADAQHWAAEWVIRLDPRLKRPAMPALALTTDSSVITAGANDIGYDRIFARQVEAFAAKGDLLIVISTSGNSDNLIKAALTAKDIGCNVLGILGKQGGRLREYCDTTVIIPSDDTQRIQEMQEFVGHILCELSEEILFAQE